MKRELAIAILAALLIMVALPVAATASPTCGSLPEFRAYDGNNQTTLLGVLCPQSSTRGTDADFSNNTGAFRTTDNDKLNSWKFYNPTSSTWCLRIHGVKNFSGADRVYNLGPTSTWWGPSGGTVGAAFENITSSVQFDRGAC